MTTTFQSTESSAEHRIFIPSAAAFLVVLMPTTLLAMLLCQHPNTPFAILSLILIIFSLYFANQKIYKIQIGNQDIKLLTYWGNRTIKDIPYSNINSAKIFLNSKTPVKLLLQTKTSPDIEINLHQYPQHEHILELLKPAINMTTIDNKNIQQLFYLLNFIILINIGNNFLEHQLLTSHTTSNLLLANSFFIGLSVFGYSAYQLKNKFHIMASMLLSFLFAFTCSLLYITAIHYYNEQNPHTQQNVSLLLINQENGHQYWSTNSQNQEKLQRLAEHELTTSFKYPLQTGFYYPLTLNKGLFNDTFILTTKK